MSLVDDCENDESILLLEGSDDNDENFVTTQIQTVSCQDVKNNDECTTNKKWPSKTVRESFSMILCRKMLIFKRFF